MRNRNYRRRRKGGHGEIPLQIIPLGGLNEIGKNMTVLRYKDEILIVDCGMTFPSDEMYGIDVVIPDMSFLLENIENIKVNSNPRS